MSRNFVILLAAWLASGAGLAVLAEPSGVLVFVFVILGWLVALVAHEYGHAAIAHHAGDHTVETNGYLSMDPLKYADPFTSVILPLAVLALGGIGLPGAAVYLRPDLMRSRTWRSLSSLAGPAGTLVMMFALVGVLYILMAIKPDAIALAQGLALLAFLQATAFILNLLPVPGLDGYGAIRPWLPPEVAFRLRKIEPDALILLVAVICLVPGAIRPIFVGAAIMMETVGVEGWLIDTGFQAFRFWT